ncbi:PdaC/SigV domain-containing protein [Saccharibacillus sp. O23]|uniref:PdaC/SigV domain-containing protein n=1 Tax=Saccharibacillus sp. O23 TaxID=2009338 RepID=UPI0015C60A7B|nr:DUF4163 domain-containing protein [Saccharibacillus sp. O23]
MQHAKQTWNKTTKMVTAAVLTAGLLLPSAAVVGTHGVYAASATASTKAAANVKVTWNGKALGANAFQAAGDTYVPVKALSKVSGISLTYDKTSGWYTLGTSPNTLVLSPYGSEVWIGANGVGLQSEGRVVGGSTYVPLSVLRDYAGIDGVWNASTRTVALKPSAKQGIKVAEKVIKSTDNGTVIDIRYPQLSGDAAGIPAINAALKKHAEDFLNDFKAQVKDFGPLDDDRDMHYEADGGYMIAYNRDGLLSVVTQDYSFYGGAHGGTLQTGYNFNIKTGKEVTLDQLLKANPNYMSAVDKKIAAQFKKDGSLLEPDGFKTIGKDPSFYVKNGGFTIFFQQYEYTPYAAGIPSFDFDFASLLPKGTNPFSGL